KDSTKNIKDRKEFVVHIVDETNVEGINQTAASLPPEENELKRTNFTLADSTEISVPGIQEARVRFECRLEKVVELGGDENNASCDLIIGKAVRYHIDDAVFEAGRINPQELGAISRLAGANYA